MDLESPAAKRRKLDTDHCIICFKFLNPKKDLVVKNPTPDGLNAILKACQHRKDNVYETLWPIQQDILSLKLKVGFHKSCRAKYTSKSNLPKHANPNSSDADPRATPENSEPTTHERISRCTTGGFDIRKACFICGKQETVRQKLTPISTGTGQTTRDKVLAASIERRDNIIHMRMIAYPDLFAYDAKYHRLCLAHYISDLNIVAARRKSEDSASITVYDEAFDKLTAHLNETVFSKQKTVTKLATLKEQFVSHLVDLGVEQAQAYTAWKLKERLNKHYGDQLVCVTLHGRTDIICSSSVTLGDALKKVSSLHEDMEATEYGDLASTEECNPVNEEQILHTAAGILRKHMASTKHTTDVYAPPEDTNIKQYGEFVPDQLYNFMEWCLNDNSYKSTTRCNNDNILKNNLKTVAICHDIIAQNQRVYTAKTLDLALELHHHFGSKCLIDLLHSLGHCASYDEVRRFLTSAAMDQSQGPDEVYIPKRLQNLRVLDDYPLIDAAIDNFDQNEATLDGKSTTHAMAAVLFHRGTSQDEGQSIPRLPKKSLSTSDRAQLGSDDLERYNKPPKRPEPPPVSDSSMLEVDKNHPEHKTAELKDLGWKVCRKLDDDTLQAKQVVPSWTATNAFLSQRNLPVASICYLPFIRAPPTDLTTIYTILLRLVKIAGELGQPHIFVTADCAIYSKAQQIMWSKPAALVGKVTMRLGGMHLTMAFVASIGKLYGDGGLLSILVDSDVYAPATAKLMLQGKQVSRGNRGLKLVQEALYRLYQGAFWTWFEQRDQAALQKDDMYNLVKDIRNAFQRGDMELARTLTEQLESEHITTLQTLQHEFTADGRRQSATFAYWDTFMQGVDTLLRLLRAERDGLFELHLDGTCEAIHWLRAADRGNYVRYLPGYLNDMMSLKEKHPKSYQYLLDGGFVVRRSSRQFNAVASDQALEQTINREGKSQGGVIGFTLRKGALTRWMMTRHITSLYSEAFREVCDGSKVTSVKKHAEHGKTRMERDERDVNKIVEYVEAAQNPFDLDTVPTELVNITTGQVASQEVSNGLGHFLEVAQKRNVAFIEKRLLADRTTSFWDTDTRSKTPTFSNMSKSLKSDKTNKTLVDSEVLFRRLLAVSKQRDVSLEEVLTHELAPVPPSLFNDDGTMRKTAKADLAKKLEANCEEILVLQQSEQNDTACIIDGMALLQALDESKFDTFEDLALVVMQKILSLLASKLGISSVTLVFDRYDALLSIKQVERDRRACGETTASYIISERRHVPNYRKFLKNAKNKSALVNFLCEFLTQNTPPLLKEHQSITLAGGFDDGELVKVIAHTTVQEQSELFSSHEEADTRILLHTIHLAATHSRIIVRCDDTDVLVLLIYYHGKGMFGNCKVFMNAGHCTKITNRQRYIPVHSITDKIGKNAALCLPACHALTGCDTTCSLFKIGKRTAYTKLMQNTEDLIPLSQLGQSSDVTETLPTAKKYALLLYGSKSKTRVSLDQLRYDYACKSDKAACLFPPTDDAFEQHVRRSNYQTAVWVHSHLAKPVLWKPDGNGWQVTDGKLEPVMFEKEAAPEEVRDLTHLYCTDEDCSQSRTCHCLNAGLKCTEFCSCNGEDCANTDDSLVHDSDSSASGSDDDSD